MNRRDLCVFLGLEIFAAIWAGAVFSFFSSRLLAGALAGGFFILSAAFMMLRAWRWPDKWSSPTFYVLAMHLFGVSIPMVVTRFLHAGQSFESVKVWGMEGPEFHALSMSVFSALILMTLVDLVRDGLRRRQPGVQR